MFEEQLLIYYSQESIMCS